MGPRADDSQKAEAINRAFPHNSKQEIRKLCLDSMKIVIKHAEFTAGPASLIDSSLTIQNRVIAPDMHFDILSEDVAHSYNGLEICKNARPWPFVCARLAAACQCQQLRDWRNYCPCSPEAQGRWNST